MIVKTFTPPTSFQNRISIPNCSFNYRAIFVILDAASDEMTFIYAILVTSLCSNNNNKKCYGHAMLYCSYHCWWCEQAFKVCTLLLQKGIQKDNTGILKNNSERCKWLVTGPGGLDMDIPSVCLIIPPPNPLSTNLANKYVHTQTHTCIEMLWRS